MWGFLRFSGCSGWSGLLFVVWIRFGVVGLLLVFGGCCVVGWIVAFGSMLRVG